MAVGLQLATKNSFVRVQEDINDNLTKLDEAIDFNLLATLGIEYGGILNNTNAKTTGKAYYDTTGKKLYKCIANTSINYADAGYFEALSNNDLLGKLQNLLSTQYNSTENIFKFRSWGNETNADNIFTPGLYNFNKNSYLNCPFEDIGQGGVLEVIRSGVGSTTDKQACCQRAINYVKNRIYIRTHNGVIWLPWKEL